MKFLLPFFLLLFFLANAAELPTGTLGAPINATSDPVTFTLTTGHGARFPNTVNGFFRVKIDSEVLAVTSRVGDSFVGIRGQRNTRKAAHSAGATVTLYTLSQDIPQNVTGLPSQTGNDGKFLTTDGSTASWETVDALPAQTGNSGKFLTTNGSSASWATFTGSTPYPVAINTDTPMPLTVSAATHGFGTSWDMKCFETATGVAVSMGYTKSPGTGDLVVPVAPTSNLSCQIGGGGIKGDPGSPGSSGKWLQTFLNCAGPCSVGETSNWKYIVPCAVAASNGTCTTPINVELGACTIDASTYPTGAPVTIELYKNPTLGGVPGNYILSGGTSVFGANPIPTLTDGSSGPAYSAPTGTGSTGTTGDFFMPKITGIGSIQPGQNVSLVCAISVSF